jgi:hypothetical protein
MEWNGEATPGRWECKFNPKKKGAVGRMPASDREERTERLRSRSPLSVHVEQCEKYKLVPEPLLARLHNSDVERLDLRSYALGGRAGGVGRGGGKGAGGLIEALGQSLGSARSLRMLILRDNDIHDDSMPVLLRELQSDVVEVLDLSCNPLGRTKNSLSGATFYSEALGLKQGATPKMPRVGEDDGEEEEEEEEEVDDEGGGGGGERGSQFKAGGQYLPETLEIAADGSICRNGPRRGYQMGNLPGNRGYIEIEEAKKKRAAERAAEPASADVEGEKLAIDRALERPQNNSNLQHGLRMRRTESEGIAALVAFIVGDRFARPKKRAPPVETATIGGSADPRGGEGAALAGVAADAESEAAPVPRGVEENGKQYGPHVTMLRDLSLENSKVGDGPVAYLADTLRRAAIGTTLDERDHAEPLSLSLTRLNLGGCLIGSSGAVALGALLASPQASSKLKELGLQWNSIKGRPAAAFFNGLAMNRSLTTLDISWNALGSRGNGWSAACAVYDQPDGMLMAMQAGGGAAVSEEQDQDSPSSFENWTSKVATSYRIEAVEERRRLQNQAGKQAEEDDDDVPEVNVKEEGGLMCLVSLARALSGNIVLQQLDVGHNHLSHPAVVVVAAAIRSNPVMLQNQRMSLAEHASTDVPYFSPRYDAHSATMAVDRLTRDSKGKINGRYASASSSSAANWQAIHVGGAGGSGQSGRSHSGPRRRGHGSKLLLPRMVQELATPSADYHEREDAMIEWSGHTGEGANAHSSANYAPAHHVLPSENMLEKLAALPMIKQANLRHHDIKQLAKLFTTRTFASGDLLMQQGDEVTDMSLFFAIEGGSVGIFRDGELVMRRGAGSYVGEKVLLQPGPVEATVVADGTCRCDCAPKKAFRYVVKKLKESMLAEQLKAERAQSPETIDPRAMNPFDPHSAPTQPLVAGEVDGVTFVTQDADDEGGSGAFGGAAIVAGAHFASPISGVLKAAGGAVQFMGGPAPSAPASAPPHLRENIRNPTNLLTSPRPPPPRMIAAEPPHLYSQEVIRGEFESNGHEFHRFGTHTKGGQGFVDTDSEDEDNYDAPRREGFGRDDDDYDAPGRDGASTATAAASGAVLGDMNPFQGVLAEGNEFDPAGGNGDRSSSYLNHRGFLNVDHEELMVTLEDDDDGEDARTAAEEAPENTDSKSKTKRKREEEAVAAEAAEWRERMGRWDVRKASVWRGRWERLERWHERFDKQVERENEERVQQKRAGFLPRELSKWRGKGAVHATDVLGGSLNGLLDDAPYYHAEGTFDAEFLLVRGGPVWKAIEEAAPRPMKNTQYGDGDSRGEMERLTSWLTMPENNERISRLYMELATMKPEPDRAADATVAAAAAAGSGSLDTPAVPVYTTRALYLLRPITIVHAMRKCGFIATNASSSSGGSLVRSSSGSGSGSGSSMLSRSSSMSREGFDSATPGSATFPSISSFIGMSSADAADLVYAEKDVDPDLLVVLTAISTALRFRESETRHPIAYALNSSSVIAPPIPATAAVPLVSTVSTIGEVADDGENSNGESDEKNDADGSEPDLAEVEVESQGRDTPILVSSTALPTTIEEGDEEESEEGSNADGSEDKDGFGESELVDGFVTLSPSTASRRLVQSVQPEVGSVRNNGFEAVCANMLRQTRLHAAEAASSAVTIKDAPVVTKAKDAPVETTRIADLTPAQAASAAAAAKVIALGYEKDERLVLGKPDFISCLLYIAVARYRKVKIKARMTAVGRYNGVDTAQALEQLLDSHFPLPQKPTAVAAAAAATNGYTQSPRGGSSANKESQLAGGSEIPTKALPKWGSSQAKPKLVRWGVFQYPCHGLGQELARHQQQKEQSPRVPTAKLEPPSMAKLASLQEQPPTSLQSEAASSAIAAAAASAAIAGGGGGGALPFNGTMGLSTTLSKDIMNAVASDSVKATRLNSADLPVFQYCNFDREVHNHWRQQQLFKAEVAESLSPFLPLLSHAFKYFCSCSYAAYLPNTKAAAGGGDSFETDPSLPISSVSAAVVPISAAGTTSQRSRNRIRQRSPIVLTPDHPDHNPNCPSLPHAANTLPLPGEPPLKGDSGRPSGPSMAEFVAAANDAGNHSELAVDVQEPVMCLRAFLSFLAWAGIMDRVFDVPQAKVCFVQARMLASTPPSIVRSNIAVPVSVMQSPLERQRTIGAASGPSTHYSITHSTRTQRIRTEAAAAATATLANGRTVDLVREECESAANDQPFPRYGVPPPPPLAEEAEEGLAFDEFIEALCIAASLKLVPSCKFIGKYRVANVAELFERVSKHAFYSAAAHDPSLREPLGQVPEEEERWHGEAQEEEEQQEEEEETKGAEKEREETKKQTDVDEEEEDDEGEEEDDDDDDDDEGEDEEEPDDEEESLAGGSDKEIERNRRRLARLPPLPRKIHKMLLLMVAHVDKHYGNADGTLVVSDVMANVAKVMKDRTHTPAQLSCFRVHGGGTDWAAFVS